MNGLEQWTVGCGTLNGQKVYRVTDADAEIARLTAELDALRADAERYRWLRSDDGGWDDGDPAIYIERTNGVLMFMGEAADKLVDAARTKEQQP